MKKTNNSELNFSALKHELKDAPFKVVFKATLGFYAAQFLATVIGFVCLAVAGVLLISFLRLVF